MSSFPYFSNIADHVTTKLSERKSNPLLISSLNCWVRITSGTGPGGLVLVSNPNYDLFKAAGAGGSAGLYGDKDTAGTLGTTWGGSPVNSGVGQGYRPSPIISSLEIDEGAGNLSRKASFTITAFSKEQMETLCKYFMEPGYSMFIEWGWNTSTAMKGLRKITAEEVAKYQSFKSTNKLREATKGEYDNYLGFMTGGSLGLDGDKWTISVNCTGYTELPAYLLTTETGEQKVNEEANLPSGQVYGTDYIDKETNVGRQRWMKCYNLLSENRRTEKLKGLEARLSNADYYINFDEEVSSIINDATDGVQFVGITWSKSTMKVDGQDVSFPKGTNISSTEKFIKFSALMDIISEIGYDGYILNGDEDKPINFRINTKDTYCSAFENIYSTDPSKLFIPNPNTPKFKLGNLTWESKITDIVTTEKPVNNSIGNIKFPFGTDASFSPNVGGILIKKTGDRYGKLDDLYVNFDFASSILGTTNFFVKDALYQILNGLSSAVNGMWNFQIQEDEIAGTNSTELRVVELNFVSDGEPAPTYTFDLIGDNSIFIDSSFDLDISGMKMNQIIGQKLSAALNGDASNLPKPGLFSEEKDMLKVAIKVNETSKSQKESLTEEDKKNLKEENLNIILGKAFFYPKVEYTEKSTLYHQDLYTICYMGAFRDTNIFSALKHNWNLKEQNNSVSPLMPINFSFKIHGVSGIKRGDMFKVNGIPTQYTKGFFQVLSVKHTLDGMTWTTEVTGGFRSK